MAKKKKAASESFAAIPNTNSRYTSPPVALRVGPDLEPYYVPEVLLQSLNDLPRLKGAERSIGLSNVGGDTAHTIVHFLYTGEYQTLPKEEKETPANAGKAEFKKAVATFIAAKIYGLTDLQDLARLEAERIGDDISVVQAAHAVGKKTLTSLQEDAGWIQGLVLRKAEQTFAETDKIFSSASFFNGIENLKLAKLLGQRVAELYRSRVRQLREQLNPSDAPRAGHDADEVVEQISDELNEAAIGDASSASHGSEKIKEEVPESSASETLGQFHYAAIEMAMQPEPELLALEEHASDAYTAVAEPDTEPFHRAEETSGIAEPPSTIVGMDEWQVVMDTISRQPKTVVPKPEDSLEAHYKSGTGPFEGIKSKKEKLRLRKKLRAEAAAKFTADEKIAAEKMGEEPNMLEIGVEETAATLQAVSAKEMPCNETKKEIGATDSPAIDPFAGLSKKQKKKKLEKKLKEEAAAKEKQGGVYAAQVVATGSDLIEPGPESAVDMDARDDETCPFCYEHLSQNDIWRNCWKFEAYMRKTAIKLHAAGLPDVNGLVAM